MVYDDGGLREKWDFSLWLMMMAIRQRQRADLGIKSDLGKPFTCTPERLVSDINVWGGKATCRNG